MGLWWLRAKLEAEHGSTIDTISNLHACSCPSWEPDCTAVALAYDESVELCRTTPRFEQYATLSLAESTAAIWQSRQLYVVTPDRVFAVFTDPAQAFVQVKQGGQGANCVWMPKEEGDDWKVKAVVAACLGAYFLIILPILTPPGHHLGQRRGHGTGTDPSLRGGEPSAPPGAAPSGTACHPGHPTLVPLAGGLAQSTLPCEPAARRRAPEVPGGAL